MRIQIQLPLSIAAIIVSTSLSDAQELTCGTYSAGKMIIPNFVAAWHNPHGTHFIDGSRSRIQAPYSGPETPSLMCLMNTWMAGWADTTLVSSAEILPNWNNQQMFAGPLDENGLPYADGCSLFNNVWTVGRHAIASHMADWADNGRMDDTLASVFGWPAQGNPYFAGIHGFQLPTDHQGGWAEFADLNENGIYDPHLGEYPCITLDGVIRVPEEMHWLVYHDQDTADHAFRTPVGMEIQLTAYGFACQDNDILNHTLFHRYKLIHQGSVPLDSLHFGIMFAYDLGCSIDDMIGCDTTRSTAFIYNRDSIDGTQHGICITGYKTFGNYPPMVSVTWLSDTFTAFTGLTNDDKRLGEEFYSNTLLGLNTDGTPMRSGGNGQAQPDTVPMTKYLYPGDPRDSMQWNAFDAPIQETHSYGVTVIRPGRMEPGDTYIADAAFGFHQDSLPNFLDQYPILLAEVDMLRLHLREMLDQCAAAPTCHPNLDCVWPGDFNADGVADPIDLLHWGVMHGSTGPARDGRINWAPHHSDTWSAWTGDDIPFQHGDANGDGHIGTTDLQIHQDHVGLINPDKPQRVLSDPGSDLYAITTRYDEEGIRNLIIRLNRPVDDLLGLAFAVDFDREIFWDNFQRIFTPSGGPALTWNGKYYEPDAHISESPMKHYAFVYSDHQGRPVAPGTDFLSFPALRPRQGVDVPDSTFIHIRHLYAVDAQGNDLGLKSSGFWLYKDMITSTTDPDSGDRSFLHPNPATDLIRVDTPVPGAADLYDTQGHLVKSWSAGELAGPLSLADLPPGLYVLRLRATGEALKVMRL